MSLLEEPWRRGFAGCDAWPEDRRIGVAEACHLQAALVAAMRGHSTSLRGTGPLSAVAVVAVVEDLLDLLIGPDEGEPPFARGAAVHGPADLGLVRCQIRESRLAHVPVAWRFIVMAISASVLVDATLSTATTPVESEAVINGPRPTLVGSLVDDEWQQWEERMSGWPIPVRARLYCATDLAKRTEQLQRRHAPGTADTLPFLRDPLAQTSDETKAAIILFFSTLDERQRRLYAWLESLRLGHGGDSRIAELTGLDVHTIRVNHKKVAGKSSPFRNQQFEYINRTRRRFERQGWPAISIDTKKRELVGRFKTAGTT